MAFAVKVINPNQELANTYLAIRDGKTLIIDPGQKIEVITTLIEKNQLEPLGILLTHGHFDHINTVPELQAKYQIPVYMFEQEIPMLDDAKLNGSLSFVGPLTYQAEVTPLYADETLNLGPFAFKVIHTPFHTSGSVCFYFNEEKTLFTGDTLFKNSIGRSDLPTGSFRTIKPSLHKLSILPADVAIYPGHGPSSTIGTEIKFNRYFKY